MPRCLARVRGMRILTGMRKYGFDDARPVLERSSARETASRVALGEVAKQFLEQAFGIRTVSHVRFHWWRRYYRSAAGHACPNRRILRRWTLLRCALLTRMRKSG